jgi:indolepyruvate ferredoxin oxidoreductase
MLDALSLDELVAHRSTHLRAYQDGAYAGRYEHWVARVGQAAGHESPITRQVAEQLARLMAYKDEYEVARLLLDSRFEAEVRSRFGAGARVHYHLAPPVLHGTLDAHGRPAKRRFGRWLRPWLGLLQHGKHLRGGPWDLFGRSAERRMERALIDRYEADLEWLLLRLAAPASEVDREALLSLTRWPEQVRGYGPVKEKNVQRAMQARDLARRQAEAIPLKAAA